jgi:hypothetical protein
VGESLAAAEIAEDGIQAPSLDVEAALVAEQQEQRFAHQVVVMEQFHVGQPPNTEEDVHKHPLVLQNGQIQGRPSVCQSFEVLLPVFEFQVISYKYRGDVGQSVTGQHPFPSSRKISIL